MTTRFQSQGSTLVQGRNQFARVIAAARHRTRCHLVGDARAAVPLPQQPGRVSRGLAGPPPPADQPPRVRQRRAGPRCRAFRVAEQRRRELDKNENVIGQLVAREETGEVETGGIQIVFVGIAAREVYRSHHASSGLGKSTGVRNSTVAVVCSPQEPDRCHGVQCSGDHRIQQHARRQISSLFDQSLGGSNNCSVLGT